MNVLFIEYVVYVVHIYMGLQDNFMYYTSCYFMLHNKVKTLGTIRTAVRGLVLRRIDGYRHFF